MKLAFSRAPEQLDLLLSLFDLPKMGATSLVSDEANELIAVMSMARKAAGLGLDRSALGAFYKEYTTDCAVRQSSSTSSSSAVLAQPAPSRLLEAACDARFVARNSVVRLTKSGVAKAGFNKDSNLDAKRAIAGNPILDSAMKGLYDVFFDGLYDSGEMKTRRPLAHQVFNGDEIGFDPNGKFRASYEYCGTAHGARAPHTRSCRLHHGERSPFWVTMFFMSCANGTHHIPPVIVHQGADATRIRGDFLLNIPGDWAVQSTPSGYMDQAGFRLVCHHLIKYSGAAHGNPIFFFLDAH
ncbi:hypothetical protein B484DRAFT_472135, partial [Ochromonadaceae sp. CCMP2298]